MNLQNYQPSAANQIPLIGYREQRRKPLMRKPVEGLADLQELQVLPPDVEAQLPELKFLELLREEERQTDEPLTAHAFNQAREFCRHLSQVVLETLPRTLIAPDGAGGIRIEWFSGDRNVRVVIPARRPAFIYHRGLGEPAVTPFSNTAAVQTLRNIILAP